MELAGEGGRITLAQLRDRLGISRKFAQGLLEALDARGVTRRVGDERILRRRGPTSPETPVPGANGSPLRPVTVVGRMLQVSPRKERAMAIASSSDLAAIESILGDDAESLLSHECTTIPRERLHLPGPDYVDRVVAASDRPIPVMRSIQAILDHGRLGGTGYVSILPVDQGIEHSAGASFAKNPDYFDPERIVQLAIEGGCNAVATTLGALGATARRYAHRIPFLLKLNHNEFLSYPNAYDQIMFASVKQAREQGCVAVGATIYFGSPESKRQIQEVTPRSRRRTSSGWRPCSGATCGTRRSTPRRTAAATTTTWRPT